MVADTVERRKALSETGNPSFATILKVARALGVRLHALTV
jgi:DNA-binding phage protein